MTPAWPALALVLADVAALAAAALLLRSTPPGLFRKNVSGRPVPAVLGLGFIAAVVLSASVTAVLARSAYGFDGVLAWALLGAVAIGVVGLLDDLADDRARGFRGHLRTLLRRRWPSTGIAKLVVGVAAGTMLALFMGGGPLRVAAAAIVITVSTNVWNALDVVPGRALKAAIVVLVPVLLVSWHGPAGLLVGAALGGAVALLPFDLLERGMLGDAGSNPLGFFVGVGLAAVLPTPAVIAVAVAVLLVQVVAETMTISRLVEATPPLRWFDRLGRRH